jgi:hypothetical protein
MGCALWWFGRLWPWLLLVAAIVLRAIAPAQLAYMALNTTTAVAEVLDANASAILGASTADVQPAGFVEELLGAFDVTLTGRVLGIN